MRPRLAILRRPALACAAASALLLTAAAAPARGATSVTIVRGSGIVRAQLTYTGGKDSFGNETFSGEHLEITRAGAMAYAAPVRSPACSPECALERFDDGPLQLADLEGAGQPNVIVSLTTGGAHCCTILQVLTFDPGVMTYRLAERNFGDPGARITDVARDGRLELESADDRFAYAFTSFAFSGLPLQIWRFSGGRFVDSTRSFPAAIAADARRQFKAFLANRRQGLGLGFIAAWAADELLLGKRQALTRTLAREARAHHLRSRDRLSPGGTAFVTKLNRFLHKTGYR